MSDFWGEVLKDIAGSTWLFLGTFALEEASYMLWRHSGSPIEGCVEASCQQPAWTYQPAEEANMEANNPDPVRPDCEFMQDPGTEPP